MQRILVIAALCVPPWAGAAQTAPDPALAACLGRHDGSTADMLDCTAAATARADARLNTAYKSIMTSSRWSAATKGRLRDAQHAWITYRGAKCIAEGELAAAGGTLANLIAQSCEQDTTAARATELEQVLAAPN